MVLNAMDFPDEVKFFPTEDSIKPECEKKTVVASAIAEEKVAKGRWSRSPVKVVRKEIEITYNEIMIGCKAILVDTQIMSTYHISQSYLSGHVLVFRASTEDIISPFTGIQNLFMLQDSPRPRPITYREKGGIIED